MASAAPPRQVNYSPTNMGTPVIYTDHSTLPRVWKSYIDIGPEGQLPVGRSMIILIEHLATGCGAPVKIGAVPRCSTF